MMIESFSDNKFPVAIIDCPWIYYGDPNKDQAAGKHYPCMTDEEVFSLPVADVLLPKSILFVWATSPRLDCAIDAIRAWGLHYRGIAFNWIKTNKAGNPINGQGARPSLIKHAGELVLWASFDKKGRPLPIKNEGMASFYFEDVPEVEMHPRPQNVHSKKPETIQDRIEQLLDGPYLEIFARRQRKGWECFGNEVETVNEPEYKIISVDYSREYLEELERYGEIERKKQLECEWHPTSEPFMIFKPIGE